MRPRPSVVAAALACLALLHAVFAMRALADSRVLVAGMQLVGAGGMLLAAVGARSRATFATGLFVAAAATAVRALASGGGPFLAPTLALAAACALAALASRRLDAGAPGAWPLALRGAFVAAAACYAGFAALIVAMGGTPVEVADLGVRAALAATVAVFADAPPIALPRREKDPPTAARSG